MIQRNGTLRIAEAAVLTGTTPGGLRMAEKRGRFPPPSRDGNGWRVFDGTDLAAIFAWRARLGAQP